MRLAANISLMFTELPLLERFQAAKNAGFHVVEIQFPYKEKIKDLVAAKEAAQVEVCLINVPAGDLMVGGEGLACVPGAEDEFKKALNICYKYAKALDVKLVNVLPGRCLEPANEYDYLETLKHNLSKAASAFGKHDILVTFEAINTRDMPGFLVHSTQQMLDIITDVDHDNLKMQFDIYHMQLMDGHVDECIEHYGHLIGHIQFSDVPGRGEPGTGNLNFIHIFEDIHRSHYHGYVAAEYKPTGNTLDSLQWMQEHDLTWLETKAVLK